MVNWRAKSVRNALCRLRGCPVSAATAVAGAPPPR